MIFFFCIYRPYLAFIVISGGDVIDGDHSGHHGMIHVVVPMLPVAAYAPKIFYFVQEIFYLIEFVIAAEIRGVGLFAFYANRIQDIVGIDDPYLGQLTDSHLREVLIGHLPKVVAIGTEVF